jgi:sterol desaturase/sphingolipid hydroxylase (fatty acid hydroxylase superfamily)
MDLIVYAIPVFFILIGLELLVQYMTKSQLYRFNDAVANINCGITQQVVGVVFKTFVFFLYLWIYENARLFTIQNTWYNWILLFIGVDFFYYFFHRYAHEIAFLWGSHAVHHQSEEYNFSVALRQSAVQALFSFWFYLPLAFIGFNPMAFITVASLQTLYQFWIHTRIIKKMPAWFEYIFNTPSHHRVHHSADPKYIDKNHGGTLIIFDRIFGTFIEEEDEIHYGVTKPIRTWNPVKANFEYYKWLWDAFWGARGIDKWHVLMQKPGWRPAYLGGPIEPQEIPEDFEKYDAQAGPWMHAYVFFQFVLMLLGTSLFLFSSDALPWSERVLYIALIIWMVVNISGIFEQRTWVRVSELSRTLFTTAVLLILHPEWTLLLKGMVSVIGVLSFMIYLTFNHLDTRSKSATFVKQVI